MTNGIYNLGLKVLCNYLKNDGVIAARYLIGNATCSVD